MLNVLAAFFALFMLARHGRAALAFVAPSLVRAAGEEGGGARTLAQVRAGEALAALGFRHLGAWRERGPLGAPAIRCDAWASADGTTYADVGDGGRGGAEVTFVSPFGDGAFVVTSNFPRVALAGALVQAGGLPGASVDAALAAHRIAAERFAGSHGLPEAFGTLAARLAAAARFRAGPGRAEVRRQSAMSFANACVALVLLAGSVKLALRALR